MQLLNKPLVNLLASLCAVCGKVNVIKECVISSDDFHLNRTIFRRDSDIRIMYLVRAASPPAGRQGEIFAPPNDVPSSRSAARDLLNRPLFFIGLNDTPTLCALREKTLRPPRLNYALCNSIPQKDRACPMSPPPAFKTKSPPTR